MELQQTILPGLGVNISTNLITSLNVLQLSAEELSQAIRQEMADNPALDVDEREPCPNCGAPLEGGLCPDCPGGSSASSDSLDYEADPYLSDDRRRERSPEADDYDPMTQVRSLATLADQLTSSLRAVLPAADTSIIEYLVGSLDELGYLTAEDEEIAEACDASLERVRAAIDVLQGQDPIGIGARNVQECLLIQLRHLATQGRSDPLAEHILTTCFDLLGRHRFDMIASQLRVRSSQVLASWDFIKNNLTPFPAWTFWGDGTGAPSGRPAYIRPDVAIRKGQDGYVVDVLEAGRYRLKIDEFYPQLMRAGDLSGDDSHFVRNCAQRARFFIRCIQQRWLTLQSITECLAEAQQEFLERGVRYLKPITRSEVAVRVGLHESTVSRATNGKFILLPNRQVVSFDELFDGSLAVKDLMREMIDGEDPRHPLSDFEIAAALEEQGIFLARRTVAKYRTAMRALPSHLRAGMAHTPAPARLLAKTA